MNIRFLPYSANHTDTLHLEMITKECIITVWAGVGSWWSVCPLPALAQHVDFLSSQWPRGQTIFLKWRLLEEQRAELPAAALHHCVRHTCACSLCSVTVFVFWRRLPHHSSLTCSTVTVTPLHFLLCELLRGGDKRLRRWRTPGGEAPTLDSSKSLCSLSGVSAGSTNSDKTRQFHGPDENKVRRLQLSHAPGSTGSGSFQLISSHFSASSLF